MGKHIDGKHRGIKKHDIDTGKSVSKMEQRKRHGGSRIEQRGRDRKVGEKLGRKIE